MLFMVFVIYQLVIIVKLVEFWPCGNGMAAGFHPIVVAR